MTVHLSRKHPCKRSSLCYYTDAEIEKLNNDQFHKKCTGVTEQSTPIFIQQKVENNQHNYYIKDSNVNITNNITINFDNLVPFNQDWDLSNIDDKDKMYFLFSKIMYTKFLEKVLENNNNQNVIIDKKTNKGLVYKDSLNGNSYVPMEFENIASESIKKLKKQLLNIHDSIHEELYEDIKNDIINGDFLDEFKKNIHQKYDNFINEKETKEKVEKMIYHIYESNQERALNVLESKVSKEKIEGY